MIQFNEKKWIAFVVILAGVMLIGAFVIEKQPSTQSEVQQIRSIKELSSLLAANDGNSYGARTALAGVAPAPQTALEDSSSSGASKGGYSTTNVQVANVDEPDFVKSDGTYFYIASSASQNVTIMQAYPAENAQVVSTLSFQGYVNQLFIFEDKLVVYGQESYQNEYAKQAQIAIPYQTRSFIRVYDVSNHANPQLIKDITYEGYYQDARMVGSYVYTLVNQPIMRSEESVTLPSVSEDGSDEKIAATSISYFPDLGGYQLSTIFALNLDNLELAQDSFLTGYTQTIYMSEKALYLTAPKQVDYRDYQKALLEEVVIPSLGEAQRDEARALPNKGDEFYSRESAIQEVVANYYNSLSLDDKRAFEQQLTERAQTFQEQWEKETQKTLIHKIELDKGSITYRAKGEVSGYILNQFSLDEFEGNLRVATTTNQNFYGGPILFAQTETTTPRLESATAPSPGDSQTMAIDPIVPTERNNADKNHVYVLDEGLNLIGKLENLAPGERIYSARFMGERAYLVTFKQIDPLFVLDLSNPSNPSVLGKLKIPGFSTYLHPFDETHVIGIGQDTQGEVTEGSIRAAIPAGLKLALFDVSDPANPQEIDRYILGNRGSESQALYDHKAFFFNAERGLLVLPVTVRSQTGAKDMWSWGKVTFQGAYVFYLTLDKGFSVRGTITHLNESEQAQLASASEHEYYYPAYDAAISRTFVIENSLYTISQREVRANDIASLQQQSRVSLPQSTPQVYPMYAAESGVAVKAA
jgi:uncharacterized secreted protein with C-terminal beta-propeller domain